MADHGLTIADLTTKRSPKVGKSGEASKGRIRTAQMPVSSALAGTSRRGWSRRDTSRHHSVALEQSVEKSLHVGLRRRLLEFSRSEPEDLVASEL